MNPRNRWSIRTSGFLAAAAAGSGLSGCKVGPDYVAPEVAASPAWSEPEGAGGAAGSTGDVHPETDWWSNFGDPTLTALVNRAIASNHDLRIAAERIVEARALRGIAASAGLPSVNTGADYTRSRQSENTKNGNFVREDGSGSDRYSVGLDASWEIDVFGGIARSVEAAEAEIAAAEESRRDVMVMLAAEVARNYVDVRGFQKRIEVTQRNIEIQTDTLALSTSRYEAGLTSELDVLQARAQLESTRSVLPTLEQNVRAGIHRLGVLVGKEPGSLLTELMSAAPIPTPPESIAAGLPSELVARRPDIRRAERELAAQTARVGVATSDLFPRFTLTGSFGLASSQFGTLADGDSRLWAVGPAVRWPIFQGGRIRSNIEAQESRERQLLLAYEQSVLVAFEDVENALVGVAREQRRRRSLSEAVTASQGAVELSTQLYRAGLADFQRVLDSQSALVLTEEGLAASEQAVAQAVVRLYKALGGGWAAGG